MKAAIVCASAPATRRDLQDHAGRQGTPFYKTKATHATALVFDNAGNLIAGTESPGKVFRIDPAGKAFLLLDSPFQEIPRPAIRRHRDTLCRH